MSGLEPIHQPYMPGAMVMAEGHVWRLMEFLPGDMVRLARPGKPDCPVPVDRIRPVTYGAVLNPRLRPFEEYPRPKQLIALERHAQVQRCILAGWTTSAIETLADEMGKKPKTAMRTMDEFFLSGEQLVSLIPGVGRYGIPHNHVRAEVKAIIDEAKIKLWATEERPPEVAVLDYIETRCRTDKLDPPARSTVRRHLEKMGEKETVTKRHGRKVARDMFRALSGRAPTGRRPYGKVEIDHTPINVLVVLPSGKVVRAWITIAIDCYTRMILGFYIGVEAPSRFRVGMCLYRVMTSKKAWLEGHGIFTDWPCIGIPERIQTDSGTEFLSLDYENTALEKKITIQNRPAEQADFGGFVERWMGHAAAITEILPGKTFRSIYKKEEYKPKEAAAMSLEELEKYFLHFVVEEYHNCSHKGLRGRSPISVWNRWHEENAEEASLRPESIQPPNELLMSLLPSFKATIQQEGVRHKGMEFCASCLYPWIKRKNPITGGRTHRFHHDPRWGRCIYWKDPETAVWHQVPTKDRTTPDLPQWELEDLLQQDDEEGKKTENKEMIDKGRMARHAIRDEVKERSTENQKERQAAKSRPKGKSTKSKNTLNSRSSAEDNYGRQGVPSRIFDKVLVDDDMWSDLPVLGGDYLD